MKNFALVCINYNSYVHLVAFAKSIEIAQKNSKIKLDIFVVDNSTDTKDAGIYQRFLETTSLSVTTMPSKNVGYFPGAKIALQYIANTSIEYDFISVSNVDLQMGSDFFSALTNLQVGSDVGVLAPSILSDKRRSNLNPKILIRPTRASLLNRLRIFQHPVLFFVYKTLGDWKSILSRSSAPRTFETMYAPHGSFIIFTRQFFNLGGNFDYPRFLFGEEVFVAESCIRLQLHIYFAPTLTIHDIDHGSTSLESLKFISREHVESLLYLTNTYFLES